MIKTDHHNDDNDDDDYDFNDGVTLAGLFGKTTSRGDVFSYCHY